MFQFLLAIIYLSFISLGLPDGLLGAAWPTMYPELEAPVSYAGVISMAICVGTIVSSLSSDRLTYKFGTGLVTAVSVALTAAALFGFASCDSVYEILFWTLPYGLGAGGVDASINNYVALHYSSRHMSWLHCMWGLGAAAGPYIMGYFLSGGNHWSQGYRAVGFLQMALTVILLFSLPMWKKRGVLAGESSGNAEKPLTFAQIFRIPGAKQIMVTFLCYCALEQTAALWASSYLVLYKGVSAEKAAFFASMFFIGITAGRGLNGFLTMKWENTRLIRFGQMVIGIGIAAMLLPMGEQVSLAGFVLIGLGCAPIYPCIIHSTPVYFGLERSQAMIGVQMASAYVGACFAPPVFGTLANHVGMVWLPIYLLGILILMFSMYEFMLKRVSE